MNKTRSAETPQCPCFEALEPRLLLSSGTLYGYEWEPDHVIPDNGGTDGAAVWEVDLTGAPSGAQITSVDVEYWIDHTRRSDLRVWLTTERSGQWYEKILWDREGDHTNDIHEKETDLSNWDDLGPDGAWYLVAADYARGGKGEIDAWKIWVNWEAPDADPDLQYAGVTYPQELLPVIEGDSFWFDVEINNAGEGPAGASHAKAWLSLDNDGETSDDYYLGEQLVAALNPADSDQVRWDFDMPDLGVGSYTVWLLVELDSQNEAGGSKLYNTNWSFPAEDPPNNPPVISGLPDRTLNEDSGLGLAGEYAGGEYAGGQGGSVPEYLGYDGETSEYLQTSDVTPTGDSYIL